MNKDNGQINVEFNDKGQAEFNIDTTSDNQILIAIMGLEGYLASKTGLDAEDIRELIDDEKKSSVVKAKVEG